MTSVHPPKDRKSWPQQVTNSIAQTVLVFVLFPVGQGNSLETKVCCCWTLVFTVYTLLQLPIYHTYKREKEREKKRKVSLMHSLDVPHLLLTLHHRIMPVFIRVNLGRTLRLTEESLVQL